MADPKCCEFHNENCEDIEEACCSACPLWVSDGRKLPSDPLTGEALMHLGHNDDVTYDSDRDEWVSHQPASGRGES